jgi:hypothetical protein
MDAVRSLGCLFWKQLEVWKTAMYVNDNSKVEKCPGLNVYQRTSELGSGFRTSAGVACVVADSGYKNSQARKQCW